MSRFVSQEVALLDRHHVGAVFQDGLRYTWQNAFTKDNTYTLFRYEDWPAWVIFTSVFMVLIVFDNVILHRNPHALTVTSAVVYTLFWILMACAFCGWVAWWYNPSSAYMWMSGYMLEWMLSFDNLFVFHMIFSVYGCPDNLKHRPLYLGIMGAVVMRLVFIFIGEWLMHAMTLMHFVFGAFLIWTGVQTVTADEEDEDPSQQPLVLWLQSKIPFVPLYDKNGYFFVQCPVKENGEDDIPEEDKVMPVVDAPTENTPLVDNESDDGVEAKKIAVVDFSKYAGYARTESRATMLFLVVVCLEVSDLLFAVDSVSAIVAQVNDLFLAYTSAVFAMLGLRATFFIIDVLVSLFSLLKYGVAIVLTFVGIKLIIGRFYHVPASIVCLVLVGAIGGSMIASVIQEKMEAKKEELKERVGEIVKKSPMPSPMPVFRTVEKATA